MALLDLVVFQTVLIFKVFKGIFKVIKGIITFILGKKEEE